MYEKYVNLSFKPSRNQLITTLHLEASNIKHAAGGVAAESSIGTWQEVTTEKSYMKKLAATVFSMKKQDKGTEIKIAYPPELFEEGNMPNILSSIAGNIFGLQELKALRLLDIDFPKSIIKSFKGPELGIKDIRRLLKIKKRPLVGTIIKPKLGLNSKDHAKVAYEAWIGGLDLVKCDENLASQKFNKFETNIKETLKMLEKAEKETGERKIYAPNVTAETKEMIRRAKLVKEKGGNCIMVDIITAGWAALQTLREENQDLKLILHAHRAGHAAFTRGKYGMSMLPIAKIARLIGVSQIHTGTANIGKMESGEEETQAVNSFLMSKWFSIKPVFPIASGGLHAGYVPKLVSLLGNDLIIQAGGGVHALGTRIGATSMRQAVDAIEKEIPLQEYSKTHKELKVALDKFGYVR
ncbi:type III ribulose-bisphosphate carboxylase [Candidatus Pacearchaeota archaeon]|nr:type III ribulose-bisphosphate carboxylase [Candidatus Pacearchaeota archaeon]